MIKLPNSPFLTADFSPKGGGIDFLGLRWVNLTMVGRDLVPELNNVTLDMGTFFLGAWIPWKFRQLCSSEKNYTERNYKVFREKVEVALSLTLRDESEIARNYGAVRNRIGATQQCILPARLSFRGAKRTDQNSLYGAPIYGPCLRSFGLIETYRSQSRGQKALDIPIAGDDSGTVRISEGVDQGLKASGCYQLLASLDSPEFTWKDIRLLGEKGLDPARYRAPEYEPLKDVFRRKLLPENHDDPGYARTLTARLLLTTLRQRPALSSWNVRKAWYTGMLPGGKPLSLRDIDLDGQRRRWSCFLARQIQRYAIELFLWCFEDALNAGQRSVAEVIAYWSDRSARAGTALTGSFQSILKTRAGSLFKTDELATSQTWNDAVDGDDDRFEYIEDPKGDGAVTSGLEMLAGWYWRMIGRQQDEKIKEQINLGESERMSMGWFLNWLRDRQDRPVRELLTDIFSALIFAQHMRIALARFDGTAQRLRFLLGDSGIEPTVSARTDMGRLALPWMPDRLDTLIALLSDCDVLQIKEEMLSCGSKAVEILPE